MELCIYRLLGAAKDAQGDLDEAVRLLRDYHQASGYIVILEQTAVELRAAIAGVEEWRAGVTCEHGVRGGDYCEQCNRDYKQAESDFLNQT